MKVNFNQPFIDLYGEPMTENGKPSLIKKTLGLLLFNLGDQNKPAFTQDEKYMAYTLSIRLANSEDEIEISEEEARFIDQVAAASFRAGAYGNIRKLLTNK